MKLLLNILLAALALAAPATTATEDLMSRSQDCVLCSSARTGYAVRTRKPPPCKGMKFKHYDPIAKKKVDFEPGYCADAKVDSVITELMELAEELQTL